MRNRPSMWAGFHRIPIIWNEYVDWTCIIHEKNGCKCNVHFSMAVPSASPCRQSRHFCARKGTSQRWRTVVPQCNARGERGENEEGDIQRFQVIIFGYGGNSRSFSLSLFPSLPLHCHSASGSSASVFLFPGRVSASQWICPGSWH